MGVQPSASRSELLLACPRPFDPEVEADEDLPGEPARYGSAFHRVIAACLSRPSSKKPLETTAAFAKEVDRAARAFDVKDASAELAGHVKSSVKVLRNWLAREKLEVVQVEKAFAVRPKADGSREVREIPPHDEDHRYDVKDGEVPGTVDLIARSPNRRRAMVIDHKTGAGETEDYSRPLTIPQMRTLGLLAASGRSRPLDEVGIFHADRRGLPAVYCEPYDGAEQREHTIALHRSLALVGQGFLRAGPQCERCKARLTCPAKAAELLSESTTVLVQSANDLVVGPIDVTQGILAPDDAELTVEDRAGILYDVLKKFRKLEKAASSEIKRLVREGAVVETRDGRVLTLTTQRYETVSKKSILAAYGKVDGERMLKKLRDAGAIHEQTRELLNPEK